MIMFSGRVRDLGDPPPPALKVMVLGRQEELRDESTLYNIASKVYLKLPLRTGRVRDVRGAYRGDIFIITGFAKISNNALQIDLLKPSDRAARTVGALSLPQVH